MPVGVCIETITPFNPRLPGGRRRPPDRDAGCHSLFQSTPSGGKATSTRLRCGTGIVGFNPRLPGGRRPEWRVEFWVDNLVSIHAFRGEGDSLSGMWYETT